MNREERRRNRCKCHQNFLGQLCLFKKIYLKFLHQSCVGIWSVVKFVKPFVQTRLCFMEVRCKAPSEKWTNGGKNQTYPLNHVITVRCPDGYVPRPDVKQRASNITCLSRALDTANRRIGQWDVDISKDPCISE